jgi:ribosome assembly protein RRB1
MKREIEEEEQSRKKGLQVAKEEEEFSDSSLESDGSEEDVVLEDDMNEELEQKMNDLKVYLPGVKMDNDEELVVDKSTYDLLHAMNVEWPCLSFDILKDKLGNDRTSYPMTSYIAAGSQAETGQNKVYVMKMSNLHKTKNDDDSDVSDDEDNDQDAVLEYKMIPHESCVNRLRVIMF